MEVGYLPDGLYAAMPFNLDIDIGMLCFKSVFHLIKRLEQASCRDHFEYRFWLLYTRAAACGAAQQGNQ
jgi:hypothetical protein